VQAKGNNSLSLEVSALLEEHTATVQRPTEAVLGWMAGETKIVASKRLRARYTPPPDEGEDGDQLAFEALGINGTTTGQVIQMQRHLEVRERTSNTFVHGLMNTALQLNGQLSAQLQDAYTRIHELQQQAIDAAQAAAAEYQQMAEPEPPAGVDGAAEARTQAIQVVTQIAQAYGPTLIQAALVRLTSPQSAIQLAPPTPPAPAPTAPSSPTPPAAPTAPAAVAVPAVSSAPATPAPASPTPRRAQRAPTRPPPARAPRGRK
jgi:hypothetical protein